MHHWNGDFQYFGDVSRAAHEIGVFCRRWGRLGGQTKEKYGTVRFYAAFGVHDFHNLTHPGWCNYAWYPKWLILLNRRVRPLFKWFGISWFFSKWQPFVYGLAYKRALKKYPHIEAEILSDADYPEFIHGHTRREGKHKLHILDSKGNIVSTWTTYGSEEET